MISLLIVTFMMFYNDFVVSYLSFNCPKGMFLDGVV